MSDPFDLKQYIRTVEDFPIPGIKFRDITSLIETPIAFVKTCEELNKITEDFKATKIASIESRGFIFAGPLALKLNCSLALARKPGKLPADKVSETYELEYGTDSLEMHVDAIQEGSNVLIMDDLLAPGGTASAVNNLVCNLGGQVQAIAFLIILNDLDGREKLGKSEVYSILEL